jgi:hypothetical protein
MSLLRAANDNIEQQKLLQQALIKQAEATIRASERPSVSALGSDR